MTLLDKANEFPREKYRAHQDVKMLVDFAQSVMPKWTYCKDAMPSKDGDYAVTVHVAIADHTFVQWSMWAGCWDIEGEDERYKVIAWMPLPEPAK